MNKSDSNPQEVKTIGLIVYSIIIILMALIPPVEQPFNSSRNVFVGWVFLFDFAYRDQIKVSYLLIEIGIATLIYIFFLYSQKK